MIGRGAVPGAIFRGETPLPQFPAFWWFCGNAVPGEILRGETPLPQHYHESQRHYESWWFCGSAVPGAICCGAATA